MNTRTTPKAQDNTWKDVSALATVVFCFGIAAGAAPTAFYVAPNGNDTWSGKLAEPAPQGNDGPFATLEKARDAVRALKAAGLQAPVDVVLRGGVYNLDKPLVLVPEDGGTKDCPITWRAKEGERVVLRGAKKITGWKLWKDGIYQADLKAQGLKGLQFHQLFYHSSTQPQAEFASRQVLARFPNVDPEHPRNGGNLYTAATSPKPRDQVAYIEGDIPFDQWKDMSQAEVVSTYMRGWQFCITPILSVDQQAHVLNVKQVRGQFLKLVRYFIQNVLDALDSPGEWYLDTKTSVLYFYPPDGKIEEGEVLVPLLDNIVEVRGALPYPYSALNVSYKGPRDKAPMPENAPAPKPVEFLNLRGLDFECAEQDALRIAGAQDCQVVSCRVTNVGNVGVNLGAATTSFWEEGNPRRVPATGQIAGAGGGGQILLFQDPCLRTRVAGCDVWSVGCEGIMLFGADNIAENCHVYNIGLYAKDAPCINLEGDRNVARKNTLHDCPRCAVFLKGVDNVVEFNDVHHTVLETCDMGAIRMVQRNAYLRGNIIRYNKVLYTQGYGFRWQDGMRYESPFFSWGVYLDDYTCGTTVEGNIIAGAGRGGVDIHGGGGNTVVNNVIVNAGTYQVDFMPMEANLGDYPHVYQGNRVERNILVCTNEGGVPYHFTRLPPDRPSMARNLIWPGQDRELQVMTSFNTVITGMKDWMAEGMDHDSVIGDPLFVDTAKDDYRLKPESPAWALGFKEIPVDQIGCYQSPERRTWPIAPNYDRVREKPVLHTAPDYNPAYEANRAPQAIPTGPVHEDFENDPVGARPKLGDLMAPTPSAIVVTEETASSGKHSLKFIDAPNLPSAWQPRLYYPLRFREGRVTCALDVRLDGKQPAAFYIDCRQYSGGGAVPRTKAGGKAPQAKGGGKAPQANAGGMEYLSGPMLHVRADGQLSAQKPLTRLPLGQWVHLELKMQLGQGAPAQTPLTVGIPGQPDQTFQVPHNSPEFQAFERIVIAGEADAAGVFYIDNVNISGEMD
ncbi:MAG: right-handed parallel beta-helix repeat-containing protein [Candidatus Sumerlaeota bacterium]|nr:right-handed parallel beta-helix repeat-containing protein [Candidatus Sumerlaeota bacterium]